MDVAQDPFRQANYRFRKADHERWHRLRSKRHILRSQLGFSDCGTTCPKVCQGCANYHGIAYGYSRTTRAVLVCAFHPYGWQHDSSCPDWTPSS